MKNNIQAIKINRKLNVWINGTMYSKEFETTSEANTAYHNVIMYKNNNNADAIHEMFNNRLAIASRCGLSYDIKTDIMYIPGFETPIPNVIVNILDDYISNSFPTKSIINFWNLLMLNPDKSIREKLFDFITKHDFVLTDWGYLVVYKAVFKLVKLSLTDAEQKFIMDKAYIVRNKWRTGLGKYVVFYNENGELSFTKEVTYSNAERSDWSFVGNLSDLFIKVNEFNDKSADGVYTDMYTKSMRIVLGEPVREKRDLCDSNHATECSKGLHVGSTKYVQKFSFSPGYGMEKRVLICLVNPAHVVAVPDYDNSKMRTCEYFPIAEAEYDNGVINIINQPYFENDYKTFEVDELNNQLELVKKNENPIPIAINSNADERSMKELMAIIQNRLVSIDNIV